MTGYENTDSWRLSDGYLLASVMVHAAMAEVLIRLGAGVDSARVHQRAFSHAGGNTAA